ncbi:hypothetical protein RRG08_066884 [Elysia crispata]|uniref:Uncharacterized protein n=1 Tax=Elysia crispata TaxID=231223 RepID=A0AAE0XWP1_9GAST|nr:hypothetical protein RRG08_066884 [Elysia crispata]
MFDKKVADSQSCQIIWRFCFEKLGFGVKVLGEAGSQLKESNSLLRSFLNPEDSETERTPCFSSIILRMELILPVILSGTAISAAERSVPKTADNEPEVKQPSADDDSINAIAVVVGVVAAAIIAVLIIVVIILLRQNPETFQAMLDRKRAAHAQSKLIPNDLPPITGARGSLTSLPAPNDLPPITEARDSLTSLPAPNDLPPITEARGSLTSLPAPNDLPPIIGARGSLTSLPAPNDLPPITEARGSLTSLPAPNDLPPITGEGAV